MVIGITQCSYLVRVQINLCTQHRAEHVQWRAVIFRHCLTDTGSGTLAACRTCSRMTRFLTLGEYEADRSRQVGRG